MTDMNTPTKERLRYVAWWYFLALEALVVTTQIIYLFSLDSRGHSSLLPRYGSNIPHTFFYALSGSFVLLLCSLPIFFWVGRRIGRIALVTLIVVVLVGLLTPES